MASTPPTVPDMTGKTCLVTGATSGIGLVTARALAGAGARVLLVGRDPARCESALAAIREATGRDSAEALVADLASQEAVRRLAREVQDRTGRLDVLVNNAGAMFEPRREGPDGIEMTWALNHLAYFLLTNLLLDLLKRSAPARVVSVASEAHRFVPGIAFDDLEGMKRYRPLRAYAQSKLANILFTRELARRLEGSGVTANCLHPGFVATRFFEPAGRVYGLMKVLARFFSIPPEAGARTSIYLATSPDVAGTTGGYFLKSRPARPSRAARDPETARRLWEVSERMTGLAGSG